MKNTKNKCQWKTDQTLQRFQGSKKWVAMITIGLATTLFSCKKEKDAETLKPLATFSSQQTTSTLVAASLPTKNDALVAMQVYNNHFYNQYGTYGSSFKAYYWKDDNHTGRMDFWTQQEAIEMLIDAYNINPSTDLKNKIT